MGLYFYYFEAFGRCAPVAAFSTNINSLLGVLYGVARSWLRASSCSSFCLPALRAVSRLLARDTVAVRLPKWGLLCIQMSFKIQK